ncbi:PLAT/LH2 domain-containing protein [Brevibacillus laterosporus]|uniref:PLAT/LH2 domain-containing protein n=1 Tax=Brevibacillus laterosporus TaxID=1465 RepID=UPI000E6BDD9C|nr:PLAT/LH2 domain-containing protein [Brevibacillus laterosporus]AYB37652.1 hypothetical protein D5F52_04770 [Brevibacillus laterosporus]MBM7110904.1 PLAT/LH2 domain protein [Brevibacillus laterosporus]
MKRFALSTMMTVALLFAGQSVYASDIAQNSNSNHKASVNPQINVAASYIYAVTVQTGDVKDAGTDSNIYVTLKGKNGMSKPTLFDIPNYNDFERGAKDKYYITVNKDLGEILAITAYSDGTGNKPGWYPTSFTVEYNDKRWVFSNNEWIGEGKGGAYSVTLTR